jgi:TPR repeat protein
MRRATKPAALAITVFLLAAAGILTHHYITRPVGPSASSHRGQAIAQSVEPSSSALNRLLAKAEADDASAQFLLGVQLLQKGNPAANASEAAAWLHKAAGSDLAIAQYRLAVLYEKGHGVPRDSDQAAAWYLSAAKLGNRLAMHNLGVAYANGNGVRQSYEDAAHWFQAAADLGLVASQFNLGVLYERGFGVPASLEQAYEWYAIAAANHRPGCRCWLPSFVRRTGSPPRGTRRPSRRTPWSQPPMKRLHLGKSLREGGSEREC